MDAYNWHFEFFEYEGFLSLREPIEEELRKYPDISGVILFHEIIFGNRHYKFYDSRYIQNKYCKSSLNVTAEELQKANIIRRYDDPLITYDKKFDFRSLDEKQQIHRLMDLINLESKLTWEDDKIELLKAIELFLCKKETDKELIMKLEPLIRKYCNDPIAYDVDATVTIGKADNFGKYLQHILDEHEDEAFELIKEIIEKFKRYEAKRGKDIALEIAVCILTHKALRFKSQKFRKYFDIILNDASYPVEVKRIIAFTCKADRLLFDQNLFDEVIKVYTTLVKSPLPSVYEYAAFHLFYNIKEKKEPYYEKIKPLLEILSKKSYDPSFPFWESAKVVIYLRAFCRQIPTEDSIMFLERLCHSHPFLVDNRAESWKVLEILECLTKDKITTKQSKEKVRSLILKLVQSGTPTADLLLKKVDNEE